MGLEFSSSGERFSKVVSNLHSLRNACKDATLEQLKMGYENLSNVIEERKQKEDMVGRKASHIPENAKYRYSDAIGQTHYWDGEGEIPLEIRRRMAMGAPLEKFLIESEEG